MTQPACGSHETSTHSIGLLAPIEIDRTSRRAVSTANVVVYHVSHIEDDALKNSLHHRIAGALALLGALPVLAAAQQAITITVGLCPEASSAQRSRSAFHSRSRKRR